MGPLEWVALLAVAAVLGVLRLFDLMARQRTKIAYLQSRLDNHAIQLAEIGPLARGAAHKLRQQAKSEGLPDPLPFAGATARPAGPGLSPSPVPRSATPTARARPHPPAA